MPGFGPSVNIRSSERKNSPECPILYVLPAPVSGRTLKAPPNEPRSTVMPRRKEREPRGVYIDRLHGWVRSVNSNGKEIHFNTSEDPMDLDIIAQAWEIELDLIDPVPNDPTPLRPSSADLRHLRLLS